jgi:hypothetical protein
MTRPGVVVQVETLPPPRSVPTDTGVSFIAGIAAQGPLEATLVQSLSQFVNYFGDRTSYSILYDAVDLFFREGGGLAYISRVVGPAAVASTHDFMDSSATPAVSLTISANSPGDWANSLSVQVTAASGTYKLVVALNSQTVETSPALTTQQDAVDWSKRYSKYLDIVVGASALPPTTVAATNLSGGTDDRASISDDDWQDALDRFTSALGPGQVLAPGRTTPAGGGQLADHAALYARAAIIDLPDTNVVADLETAAEQAGQSNGQYAACFTPWLVIPGVTANTTRTVPPSAAIAGMLTRNDRLNGVGSAAAGQNGQFLSVIGLSQPAFADSDRENLNYAGIDVVRAMFGGFRNYGFRSLANPISDPAWLDFSAARYLMGLYYRCAQIGENYLFQSIDGFGRLFSSFAADLSALCQADYQNGILFGASATDAYSVDTGPAVNTPETIANGEIRANVAVRLSPFSELVTIEIVNVPILEAV